MNYKKRYVWTVVILASIFVFSSQIFALDAQMTNPDQQVMKKFQALIEKKTIEHGDERLQHNLKYLEYVKMNNLTNNRLVTMVTDIVLRGKTDLPKKLAQREHDQKLVSNALSKIWWSVYASETSGSLWEVVSYDKDKEKKEDENEKNDNRIKILWWTTRAEISTDTIAAAVMKTPDVSKKKTTSKETETVSIKEEEKKTVEAVQEKHEWYWLTAEQKKQEEEASKRVVAAFSNQILEKRAFDPAKDWYTNGRWPWYCTHGAWRYRWDEFWIMTNRRWNGAERFTNAQAAGREVGQSPEKGAIYVQNKTVAAWYWHVWVVLAIDEKYGLILVQDMNFTKRYEFTKRRVSLENKTLVGFIYPREAK